MYNGPKPNDIEDWVCIMERGTEYEVEIAKNYLSDHDIPANILSKRDSAISVNVGDMSMVYLYVPRDYEEEARRLLEDVEEPDTDNQEE